MAAGVFDCGSGVIDNGSNGLMVGMIMGVAKSW